MTNYQKVKEFMRTFGQTVEQYPTIPSMEIVNLRYSLIKEELDEFDEAIKNNDIVEMADALVDILYVTYGALAAFGLPADKLFQEVHRSNMSKLGADGKPIYREDGKVMKGPNYTPPDLASIVRSHTEAKRILQKFIDAGIVKQHNPSAGWEKTEA